MMRLSCDQRVRPADPRDREPCAKPRSIRSANRISVKAGSSPNPPGNRAAVPKVYGDNVVRLSRLNKDRRDHGAIAIMEFNSICKDLAAYTAHPVRRIVIDQVAYAKARCSSRANNCRIVPCESVNWLGQ